MTYLYVSKQTLKHIILWLHNPSQTSISLSFLHTLTHMPMHTHSLSFSLTRTNPFIPITITLFLSHTHSGTDLLLQSLSLCLPVCRSECLSVSLSLSLSHTHTLPYPLYFILSHTRKRAQKTLRIWIIFRGAPKIASHGLTEKCEKMISDGIVERNDLASQLPSYRWNWL